MANDVEGRLIFDKIGDTNYLAELWLPDQDGFVLHATNEPRTHTSVKLDRGGKAHS